jgi:4'-phosphopantetheinyl transferase
MIYEILYKERGERLNKDDPGTLARRLLSFGLQNEYGITDTRSIARTSLGKPYLQEYPDIHFNYSHCPVGILCGIHHMEIGVDMERRIPYKENLARRISSPEEWKLLVKAEDPGRVLTALWTAKEAYVKFLGTGIRRDLREIDLSRELAGQRTDKGILLYSQVEETYGICVCSREPIKELLEVKIEEKELSLENRKTMSYYNNQSVTI